MLLAVDWPPVGSNNTGPTAGARPDLSELSTGSSDGGGEALGATAAEATTGGAAPSNGPGAEPGAREARRRHRGSRRGQMMRQLAVARFAVQDWTERLWQVLIDPPFWALCMLMTGLHFPCLFKGRASGGGACFWVVFRVINSL